MDSKPKILIIDKDSEYAEAVKAAIKELMPTAEVLTALTGKRGVEIARKADPDVILLDIDMPEINGFEVCKIIKHENVIQPIPVLLLTKTKTSHPVLMQAIEAGAEAFLSKECSDNDLISQIRCLAKIKADSIRVIYETDRVLPADLDNDIRFRKEFVLSSEAETKLIESEARYRRLFETATDGIMIIDQNTGVIIDVNHSLVSMFGYSAELYINKAIWDTELFKDIVRNRVDFLEFHQREHIIFEDLRLLTVDGCELVVECVSNVYFAEKRTVLQCNIRDITERKKAQDAFMKTASLLDATLHSTADGILVVNLAGKISYYNDQFIKMWNIPDDIILKSDDTELLNFVLKDIIDPESFLNSVSDIYKKQDTSFLDEIYLKNGNVYERNSIPQLQNGKIVGRVWSFRDITIQKRSQNELIESQERYKSMFIQSPIGIAIGDSLSGRFLNINPKFAEITGRTIDELINADWMSITHPDDIQSDKDYMDQFNAGTIDSYNMDKRYLKPNGDVAWINMTISPLRVEGKPKRHLCMIIEITEKKEKESRIEYLSYRDVLTDLHNRAFFIEETARLDNEEFLPLSTITGDINGLKIINDTFGHAQGDKLLIEAANILKGCCRKNDIVARVGGDEFSILLPKTDSEDTKAVVDRIYAACEEYKDNNNSELMLLSISLGYATKHSTFESFDDIAKIAEDNMYKRKLMESQSLHSSLITSIRKTLFEKSQETEEHIKNLIRLSRNLGKLIGLDDKGFKDLELLSSLHDIGKISVDDQILLKTKGLSATEWYEIKKHPAIGFRIALASPELESIADYILCHHEHWDGKGYPQGLSGNNIPLLSRIISVVDAYDSMTTDKPYRKAMQAEDALTEIEKNSGTQFDPEIAELFVKMIRLKLKSGLSLRVL